jgi:hypothetical protein
MTDDEFIEERYLELLKPLQNAASYWDIDLKTYLDEYLNKLARDRERNAHFNSQDGEVIK